MEEEGYCWMTPLIEYLAEGTLPANTKKARAVRIKARQYVMINGVLYRKSFLEPWLRCVGPTQAEYVAKEIHEGSCSMHSGLRSIVAKAIRFGLPGEIISDNEKQFRDNPFKDWCEKLNIKQRFASVKHPQSNGQVERANRSLGEEIKARDTSFSLTYGTEAVIPVEIGMPSLRCAEVNQAENDEELLLNLDILEERREKLFLTPIPFPPPPLHWGGPCREAKSKAKMEKYYNARVRSTAFRLGDFVYRNNEASNAKNSGKLGPKWERPYEVVEALGRGTYKLRNESRDILPRT
ncbi:reverse transcriptase domain-containing protein [Tanacetum coccineum]